MRDGDTIMSVEQQSAKMRYGGVQVFRFDKHRRLLSVGRAETASVDESNRWHLENFLETRFVGSGTVAARTPAQELSSSLSADFLGLAVVEPETMGLRDLVSYIRHLRENGLDATGFQIAFWSRTSRFVATVLVVILALPFALGPMRASGQGARTVVGILIGAAFVLMSRTLESSGQLFDLPPAVVGWFPTAILLLLTVVLLGRTR
jgi:lipopolysaccharide export system permease protein